MGSLTPNELLGQSSVAADPSTDLLRFTVEDRSRQRAERLVNAYARAYVRYRHAIDTAPFLSAGRQLEHRLEELRAQGRSSSSLSDTLASRQQELTGHAQRRRRDPVGAEQ